MSKADRFTKSKICQYLFFSLLFSPLFFYFILEIPEFSIIVVISLYVFWILSLLLDMKSTLSIKEKIKQHEANHVFRILYTRFSPRVAITLQLIIEISFVMLFPTISTIREAGQSFMIDWIGSAILGGIIGVLHIVAWYQNKKTIQHIDDQKYV